MKLKLKNGGLNIPIFSKFFKLLKIIFFIKPYVDVKLKRINFLKKNLSTNYLFKKKDIANI